MIGNILLTIALISSVFAGVMYYLNYKGYENTLKFARAGYHITAISVILASVALLYAILTHQFQYEYVYNYSNNDLSLGMLISTFYAGQQGSFMLWLLMTSIIGIILMNYTSKRGDLEPRVMISFILAIFFLLVMVSPFLQSPFIYLWSEPVYISIKSVNPVYLNSAFLQGQIFQNTSTGENFVKLTPQLYGTLKAAGIAMNDFIIHGKGLNPLLQNFWMQIHPPMLFTGFALSTVPFSFSLAALLKNDYKNWVRQSFPWTIAAMMILGLAIMLGGYWAYGVLGWGGYWGWDPVENSSLVPWLVGVALIHTMLIQKRSQKNGGIGRYAKTNIILGLLVYVLVLYSTFLTRSGILGDASVHSFVDPGMTVYLLLLLFIISFLIIGLAAIVWRWKYLSRISTGEDSLISRELALFTGAVSLLAVAIIVIVGTSAPIFSKAVDTSFYNQMNLPIAIIIGLLNGFSLLIRWKQNDNKLVVKKLTLPLIISIAITLLLVLFAGLNNLMLALLTFSSLFALYVNGEITIKIFRKKATHIGAYVTHIGMALFLLGVVASGGFSVKKSIDLPEGENISALGYNFTFIGYRPIENGKKFAFEVKINKGNTDRIVAPVMYMSDYNNSLMREPDIAEGFLKDLYISPLGYSDKSSKSSGKEFTLKKGESVNYNNITLTFEDFQRSENAIENMQAGKPFYIGAKIKVVKNSKEYFALPKFQNNGSGGKYVPFVIKELGLTVALKKLNASGSVTVNLSDNKENNRSMEIKDVLSIEASIKPLISFVWLGVLLMVVGFFISMLKRIREAQA